MQRIDLNQFQNKKIALVLSGGVVKAAAWHIGVSIALEEQGFTFKHNKSAPSPLDISTYVGSSAGALINLYLASGFGPMDIVEASLNPKKAKIPPVSYKDMMSLKKPGSQPPRSSFYDPFDGLPIFLKQVLKPVLSLSGIFTTKGLQEYMTRHIITGQTFEDYLCDMFVVATQLDHSRKVIFGKYNYPNPSHDSTAEYYTDSNVADSVAASMSVPPLYSPYPIENNHTGKTDYYIDGEIRETLSTHVALDNQCDLVISSWTHTPYHYQDEIGSLINYGLPAICIQAIYLMIQKKIISARARRTSAYDIIDTVNDYMKTHNFDEIHRKRITGILERKLHTKRNVQFIDIHPEHDNYKMFFNNTFSLNPSKMSEVVSYGYKRTMRVFREHEWEN